MFKIKSLIITTIFILLISHSFSQQRMPSPEKRISHLKAALLLDKKQTATVKSIFAKMQPQTDKIIQNTSFSKAERRNKMKKILADINVKIKAILNPEQIQKFNELITEQSGRLNRSNK